MQNNPLFLKYVRRMLFLIAKCNGGSVRTDDAVFSRKMEIVFLNPLIGGHLKTLENLSLGSFSYYNLIFMTAWFMYTSLIYMEINLCRLR